MEAVRGWVWIFSGIALYKKSDILKELSPLQRSKIVLAYIVSQEEHSGLLLAANNRKIRWNFLEVKLHGRSDKGT